jgi:regulator of protease activity HflC (stomatin/prohibitin superfamily)
MVSSTGPLITLCLCGVGLVGLLVMMMLMTSIRIVPESQRLTVFRLGRSIGERGPGLVLLLPFIDRAVPAHSGDPPRAASGRNAHSGERPHPGS